MIEIILAVGVLTFMVYAAFQIFYLVELRRTGRALRMLIEHIDARLTPSLDELQSAARNLRQTTEHAAAVGRNLREATDIAGIIAGVWAAVKAGLSALTRKDEIKQDEQQ